METKKPQLDDYVLGKTLGEGYHAKVLFPFAFNVFLHIYLLPTNSLTQPIHFSLFLYFPGVLFSKSIKIHLSITLIKL